MELDLDYRIYKSYRVEEKIGKGAYGEVFKAIEKTSGRPVAIKKIIEAFQNLTDAKRTYRQLGYLLQIHHPSIVRLHQVIIGEHTKPNSSTPHNVYAIFQLMNLDLAKTLKLCRLEPLQRKYIALQIVSALQFLHSCGLIHRDIKPSNILVDESCTAKICDFGLVRRVGDFSDRDQQDEEIFTEYVASKWYRAPEVMLNGNNVSSGAIDMWSLGCVVAEMILGQCLFTGNSMIEQLEKMFSIIGMPQQKQIDCLSSEESKFLLRNFKKLQRTNRDVMLVDATPQELDFVKALLVFDPAKRLTASQALRHPFFDQLKNQKSQFKGIPSKVVDYSEQKNIATLQDYCQLIESLCIQTQRTSKSRESLNQIRSYGENDHFLSHQKVDFMPEKSTRSSNCGIRGVKNGKSPLIGQQASNKQVQEFYRIINKPGSQSTLLSKKSNEIPVKRKKDSNHKSRSKSRKGSNKDKMQSTIKSSSLHKSSKSIKSKQSVKTRNGISKPKVFRPVSEANLVKTSNKGLIKPVASKLVKKKKKN